MARPLSIRMKKISQRALAMAGDLDIIAELYALEEEFDLSQAARRWAFELRGVGRRALPDPEPQP